MEHLESVAPSALAEVEHLAWLTNQYSLGGEWRRQWIATLLSRMPTPMRSRRLFELTLSDTSPLVRASALESLRRVSPTSARKWARRLLRDKSGLVRAEAVETHLDLSIKLPTRQIARLLRDRDQLVRFHATLVAGSIARPGSDSYRLLRQRESAERDGSVLAIVHEGLYRADHASRHLAALLDLAIGKSAGGRWQSFRVLTDLRRHHLEEINSASKDNRARMRVVRALQRRQSPDQWLRNSH